MIHSFEPGGVERVAVRLNAAWQAMGVNAQLVVGRDARGPVPANASVAWRTMPGDDSGTARTQLARMIRHLPAIIRAERPDILFCPGNTYSVVGSAMKLLLGRDCPLIVNKVSNDLHRHDLSQAARSFYHQWLRVSGRMIDRFVAMAPSMVAEIADLANVPRERIAIINDPVLTSSDLARCADLTHQLSPRGRRFLAVGRLVPQKNFPLLLNAFAQIACHDDRLTILGDGAQRAALLRQAVRLGIADQVNLPGHMDDVMPWLADTDVFVMSSNYEGVPAAVIEAIAARVPVVATRCSASMADLTGHGRFGTLVPVGDAAAFAHAMDTAPAGRQLSGDALAHARNFTVEAGASAYLAVMRGMLGHETYHPDHGVRLGIAGVG